jgi:predicted RNA-binding protein YlxR (DUF448 family)
MRLIAVREDAGATALAVHDPSATMPGRGAYLCLDRRGAGAEPDCLARATRRGAIARALRCPVIVASERLESVSP